LQLQHQQREDDEQHGRHVHEDRALPLRAFFSGTAQLNAVPLGQLRLQGLDLGPQGLAHGRALHAITHIGLHGDGELAALPPQHAGLPDQFGLGHLADRDHPAAGGGHVGTGQVFQGFALGQGGGQHDVDQAIIFAVLGHDVAGVAHPAGLGDGLGAHAQGAGLVLVHHQADGLDGLVPVVIHTIQIGVVAQDDLGLVGRLAQHLGVRPHDAELHRVRHGRAVGQQANPATGLRELGRQHLREPLAQGFALGQALGQHHHLGNVALREDLVHGQVEARQAGADPGADRAHALFLHHPGLEALGHFLSGMDAAAFGHPQVHDQLGPAGIGEELLLHLAHADHTEHHGQSRQADGDPAVGDAPVHQRTETVVERGVVKVGTLPFGRDLGAGLEQTQPQVGHKVHRHHPGDDQGGSRDGEDGKRVLTHGGIGHADGQEAGGSDERARQHGHGRDVVGGDGRAELVVALFQLVHHHLDRDDGVVHQQAQGDDQGPQRDFVQAHVPEVHHQEGDGQHQGDGDGHHQAWPDVQAQGFGVQPQAEEADDQHHHHGLDQHLDELAHRGGNRLGLVLDLRQLDAHGQFTADALGGGFQRLAQGNDVAPLGHGHAQCNDLLPLVAHLGRGRLLIPTPDDGHITQLEGAALAGLGVDGADGQALEVIDRLQGTVHAHGHAQLFAGVHTTAFDDVLGIELRHDAGA